MKLYRFLIKIVRSIYTTKRANNALYCVIASLTKRNLELLQRNVELEYYQGFKPLRCVKYKKQKAD